MVQQGSRQLPEIRRRDTLASRLQENSNIRSKTMREATSPLAEQKTGSCKTAPVCEQYKLHNFRKTSATKLHMHGTALNDLGQWLGHKDLRTTELYLAGSESDAPHVRAAVDAAFSF
jgi:site-specific recombinase XerD